MNFLPFQATDRLKTEEEIAKEEKEKLEEQEVMYGVHHKIIKLLIEYVL